MSSLEKFAKFANPDKLLMVGEALVGTDSVAQARNFNAAFGATRRLDGFIISKCDTVGDMVSSPPATIYASRLISPRLELSFPWYMRRGHPFYSWVCDSLPFVNERQHTNLLIGVGQHYSDIRSLNVKWAVDKLLSPV